MNLHDAPTWTAELSTPSRLARRGYVAYLRDPDQHTNAAGNGPGWGVTPTDALQASTYWANQLPWVSVVRYERAPAWARRAVEEEV